MALEELKQRVEELSKRYASATKKRSELQGQLEAKKAELVALSNEIKAAGYDPKKLKEEKEAAEKELITMIDVCEKDLSEVEAALKAFDKK